MKQIESCIFIIRGQRVMLDCDLAKLYGVQTKVLNQSIKRNLDRFPEDFMFKLNKNEFDIIKFESIEYSKNKYLPFAFTENGVAMLSSVLNSKTAIQVNISIIRTFTRLRSFLAMESSLNNRVDKLEADTTKIFKIVFEKLDFIENQINPKISPNRKKIGIKIE